jgi:membrane protein implicated in regulation of membrane protease activity
MNLYAALGLGTVAMIAAVALYLSGNTIAAIVAFGITVVFDMLFVAALRRAAAQRRESGKQN